MAMIVTGCASRGTAIPQGGMTMAEVYEEAMQSSSNEKIDQVRNEVTQQVRADQSLNLSAYTRTTEKEINNLFPILSNPMLSMYVYPHLASDEQLPVPGYTTAFLLYEKNYYAMAGEK
jgi:conjugative transfer region lipoprotein (TIGR03751 family)